MASRLGPARPRRAERGAALVFVAIGMVTILVIAAFAIDLGNARQVKGAAESAADAGALAGAGALARFGGDDGTAVTARNRAAEWVFKNLSLPMPAATACGVAVCYNANDADNTVVEVTSPYLPDRTQADGTAYDSTQLLHVRICRDVKYNIATVIGLSSKRVCADSTARGMPPSGVNSDAQDELNDPYAKCPNANQAALFDEAHWFPADRKLKDGVIFGGTYLYAVDLDRDSVRFTIDGVDYTENGNAAPTNTAAVQIVSKGLTGGKYKWEIKYNKLPSKAALGNGIHSAALYVRSQDGKCYQSVWTFLVNQAKKSTGSPCQEDLFRGGSNPASGAQVQPGDVVGATYYDETPLFTYTGTDPGTLSRNLIFNIDPADNSSGGPDPAANVTIQSVNTDNIVPPPGVAYRYDFLGNGQGEYKYGTKIWYTLPATLANGQHTIYLRAYDSDQNKTGGDCGIAQWTINFSGGVGSGSGRVELVE